LTVPLRDKRCLIMKKKRRTGIILFAVLVFIVSLSYIYSNILFFRDMFSELLSQLFLQLFLMSLYAIIPCVPAVILRAKFGFRALKGIALAATILGGVCCIIHILLPDSILNEEVILYEDASVVVISYVNNWIFVFTQCALTSSVPVLYCIAFIGIGKGSAILVALAPSLMFFVTLVIRYFMIYGFLKTFEFILDQTILMLVVSSVAYALWALLIIFISHMIYIFINRVKIKKLG